MQIGKVLVPIDFSPPSILALDYGIAFARKMRATLSLLTVIEDAAPEVEERFRLQATNMLSALVSPEDQDDLDLRVLVKTGDIEKQIAAAISEQQPGLVVMGTHGRRLLGRVLIGSVTHSMLRKLKVPVLTVCHGNRLPVFSRILFATDLSDSSKEGFRFAIELARLTRSTLILFHVVSEVILTYGGGAMADYVETQRLELARSRMASYVREAEGSGVPIETLLQEGRSVAEKVVEAVDESDADLVILTLEQRGMLERTLLGTTAERVIREANAPVLSVPAGTVVDLLSSTSEKETTNKDLKSTT